MLFAYTVQATFDEVRTMEEWLAWLRDEHLADVLSAGAASAEVIRCDANAGEKTRCEVRYRFATRKDFERYEQMHAPRLRAEGLKKFPPERGVAYQRTTGDVLLSQPVSSHRGMST